MFDYPRETFFSFIWRHQWWIKPGISEQEWGGGDAVLAWYNSWGLGCVGPGRVIEGAWSTKNYGIWAGKDLDYATPAVTHGFSFCCRVWLIYLPFATNKGNWGVRTHTNMVPIQTGFMCTVLKMKMIIFIRSFQLIISHNICMDPWSNTYKILKKMMYFKCNIVSKLKYVGFFFTTAS